MKVLWIALLLCAGFILALAFLVPGDTHMTDSSSISPVMGFFPGERQVNMTGNAFPAGNVAGRDAKTAIFSKYVAAGTPYIVISLYSGDPSDPLSVTIITPDKTLGPYYDASDGKIDGRIDLKITNPDTVTPGYWKFLVHSRKDIKYGSLENLSWIRAGT